MRKDIIAALETDEQTAVLIEQCYLEANKLDKGVELTIKNNIVSIASRGEQPRFYFFSKEMKRNKFGRKLKN